MLFLPYIIRLSFYPLVIRPPTCPERKFWSFPLLHCHERSVGNGNNFISSHLGFSLLWLYWRSPPLELSHEASRPSCTLFDHLLSSILIVEILRDFHLCPQPQVRPTADLFTAKTCTAAGIKFLIPCCMSSRIDAHEQTVLLHLLPSCDADFPACFWLSNSLFWNALSVQLRLRPLVA